MTSAKTLPRLRAYSILGFAAVLTAFLFLTPLQGSADSAGVRYTDVEYKYSLTPPPGWTQKTNMPRPLVAFLGPVEDGFRTNFHVDPEPAANKTLAQFVKVARETAAKDKAVHLRSERKATLAGGPAVILQSVVTLEGQPPSIAHQIVAVHGGRGYTITFAVAPTALKKNLPAFNKVIASFRWRR